MLISPCQRGLNILIVGPSWVGDMVMAQSLFKVLKKLYSDCQIDVLAPAWSRPIVAAMPEVRASIDMPVGHGSLQWGLRKELAETLRARYDWAIVLPNSLKSALIPWMARIPRRTGWRGEMRYGLLTDVRRLDEKAMPLMVQRFVALAYEKGQADLAEIPIPQLHLDQSQVARVAEKFGVVKGAWRIAETGQRVSARKVLGLCPGAEFGIAKQWPESHYAAIAQAHLDAGGQVWLFGSAKDRAVTNGITARLMSGKERAVDFAGQTSLEEAVALLSMTDQVVSNDSGLMHVAAALARPLVAVYGSTSPDFTPPLGENARIVRSGISCSPCFKRECPYGHYNCLRELPPQMVADALKQVVASDEKESPSVAAWLSSSRQI
jgi:heptosyltransferase-2